MSDKMDGRIELDSLGVFKDLNFGLIARDLDDLCEKRLVAYFDMSHLPLPNRPVKTDVQKVSKGLNDGACRIFLLIHNDLSAPLRCVPFPDPAPPKIRRESAERYKRGLDRSRSLAALPSLRSDRTDIQEERNGASADRKQFP